MHLLQTSNSNSHVQFDVSWGFHINKDSSRSLLGCDAV